MMSISKNFLTVSILLIGFCIQAMPVHVLLDEKKAGDAQGWTLTSSKGFGLRDRSTHRALTLKGTRNSFVLECRKDGVYHEGTKLLTNNMLFEPINGVVRCNGKRYQGAFYIQRDKNSYYLINILPLEDYVFSVLKTESWPGWPLEVNKVFAIACRSYLLHQLLTSRAQKLPYHIKNTNHHQTYTGMHDCPVIAQAVQETQGIFLGYQGKPILAMFDCCCGGVVPASIEGSVDFKKAPYLGRDYACTFCKNCKIFKWSISYDLDQFIDLIQEGSSTIIHDIKDVKVSRKDKAGLVKGVTVTTPRGLVAFGAQQMYRLFKEVKSYCFAITKKGKKVTLSGQGYGHHVGLCQWGAREMVNRGFDHQKILAFYYPETAFMKLEKNI